MRSVSTQKPGALGGTDSAVKALPQGLPTENSIRRRVLSALGEQSSWHYGLAKPKTTSVVPGFENGVSCPPAATATMSRPLAVVKTSGVARALVGS